MESHRPNTSPPQPKKPRLSDPTDPPIVDPLPAAGEQWQSSVRQDERDHLIKKILNGIYPVSDYTSAMNHPEYSRLVHLIRGVEDNFFRTCTSKDEYAAKLDDKYQHIVKELQRIYPGYRGMDAVSIPSDEGTGPKDPKEALNRAIQRFIQILVHAAQCRDRACESPSCVKMKRIMHHVGRCKQCSVCKQFINLCYQHAKTCKTTNCPVPLCANLKKHILEKQRQTSIKENRFAARRMAAMAQLTASSSQSSSSSSTSNGAAAVQSPAPSTPVRQPSTPQVTNSPAPSPAVSRNPPSIPPPSHSSPGGKALGALQQSQEVQQPHGPPSVPSKPISAAVPSPHPATSVSYQPPGGPPSVNPPGREHIMKIRTNPQVAMEALSQMSQPTAQYPGQPQTQGVRPMSNSNCVLIFK